jgi:hypothetical protein
MKLVSLIVVPVALVLMASGVSAQTVPRYNVRIPPPRAVWV